ncbi:amidohydrolase family protein [Microbacterium sp. VKM Ac-2870]|uniref:amidohydrolase n=1 Tax=Microbacterium sp. VKM Ac-2870 TaxID=2783825 RepID=UPI00188C2A78|nr:amidohydrolase [Microbacterium sp. VKM Ac-2870]MBF4562824.1 amidohydrolase family protein [Microbacterium sp. VKM Ac-2870]
MLSKAIPGLIVRNARITTMDPLRPSATVLVIRGGIIAAVGDDDLIARHSDLAVHDLGGRAVLPGFIDVHNHHAVAGRADLFELVLPVDATFDEILAAVRGWSANLQPDEWVVGGSWSSTLGTRLSHADAAVLLDEAAGGRPVSLGDDSHHNRWASTTALRLAGIGAATPDPAGGRVVRDAETGAPTGLLYESAGLPIEEALSAPRALSSDQHARSSARAIEILHGYGITGFQDAGATAEILASLHDLDQAGRLQAWVVTSMLINDAIFGADPVGDALIVQGERSRSTHHRPDFVKIFLDGVPPTRTGAFLEPYLPDDVHGAHHRGQLAMPADELLRWLLSTAERGLSAKIHCTGDAAVRAALDAIEAVRDAGHSAPRYQIAHGQFVAGSDIRRFAELDVSADISPFLWTPGVIPDAIAAVLPAEVAAHMHPNRSLLDAGAVVAVGSDWPVSESPDPLEAIQGLVTRADPHGEHPGTLWAEQAITLDEAIASVTISAAQAMGVDDVTGSLEAGKSADFIVLGRELTSIPVSEIVDNRVQETWFAGSRVYEQR